LARSCWQHARKSARQRTRLERARVGDRECRSFNRRLAVMPSCEDRRSEVQMPERNRCRRLRCSPEAPRWWRPAGRKTSVRIAPPDMRSCAWLRRQRARNQRTNGSETDRELIAGNTRVRMIRERPATASVRPGTGSRRGTVSKGKQREKTRAAEGLGMLIGRLQRVYPRRPCCPATGQFGEEPPCAS
jgi:hypothetical protein